MERNSRLSRSKARLVHLRSINAIYEAPPDRETVTRMSYFLRLPRNEHKIAFAIAGDVGGKIVRNCIVPCLALFPLTRKVLMQENWWEFDSRNGIIYFFLFY